MKQQEFTDLPANAKYQKYFEQWHSPKKIPTLKGMVIWSLSLTLYHTSYGFYSTSKDWRVIITFLLKEDEYQLPVLQINIIKNSDS